MTSFDDQGFPVVHLSSDGWSTEDEATAVGLCVREWKVTHIAPACKSAKEKHPGLMRSTQSLTSTLIYVPLTREGRNIGL
jgi:hypothetical protein